MRAFLSWSLSRLSGGEVSAMTLNAAAPSLSRLSGGEDAAFALGVRGRSLSRLSGGEEKSARP